MAADMMLSLDEKADLYRAIRGTYWTYQLSAYEEAAIKGLLPVVEEAGKRMHATVEELSGRGKEGSWQVARAGQVEREMERLTAALNADITGNIVAASGTVGSAAVKEYNEILSLGGVIRTSAVALSPSQFASFFTESLPFMIPKVVTSMLNRAELADMQNSLLREMRIGALTGASYDRMVKGLRQQFPELMRGELTTMTRTFFQTANARAFDRVYKENADILVGKTWISANDDRVCLMCLPLGGKTFYKGESHPPMPRHPRCRCLFIPKTKSLKKLGVDVKKVEKTVDPVILRGKMKDGKWIIPQVGTGGAAPGKPFTVLPGGLRAGFTSLSEEVKLSMLGRGRYEMMKAGLLKVDDLIDYKTGRLYTLEELRTRISSPPLPAATKIKTVPGRKTPPTPSLTAPPLLEEISVVAETGADIELTALQKKALDFVDVRAKGAENEILDQMSEYYGVPRAVLEKQYEELKLALLAEDKFELTFNAIGSPAMWKSLAKDGKFKNQFELGRKATSGGSLCPVKGGQRDTWEKRLYGGTFQGSEEYIEMRNKAYFKPELGRERPFYGYVHDASKMSHDGQAFVPGDTQYGRIAFVLDKKRVIDRTTLTVGNSSGYSYSPGQRRPISTVRNPIALLDSLYDVEVQHRKGSVAERIEQVTQKIKDGKGIAGGYRYVEAQYIGGITLDDVKVVMIPKGWLTDASRTEKLKDLTDMLSKKKVPYVFHGYDEGKGLSAYLDEARGAAKKAVESARGAGAAAAKKAAEELAAKKAAGEAAARKAEALAAKKAAEQAAHKK